MLYTETVAILVSSPGIAFKFAGDENRNTTLKLGRGGVISSQIIQASGLLVPTVLKMIVVGLLYCVFFLALFY